ncbi:MAG TPA: hypothetical protein VF622_14755 [Segetibacter sp.]
MRMLFALCIFSAVLPSCSNNAPFNNLDIQNAVYLFGPALDSATVKIETACDCCTSNVAFFKDSTFIQIAYCVSGDHYSKGKFSVNGKEITLRFDSLSVTQSFGFVADTAYEVSNIPLPNSTIHITNYKSKQVLLYKSAGTTEYGIKDESITHNKLLERLKADSIWQKLHVK